MLDGFLAIRFSNFNRLIVSQWIGLLGIILLWISQDLRLARMALVIMGFGFAPNFPIMMHETPVRFSQKMASVVIGLQMAFANLGFLWMPLVIGQIAKSLTLKFLPIFMLSMMLILVFSTLMIQKKVKEKNAIALD